MLLLCAFLCHIVPSGPAQELNVSVVSFEEVVISWEPPDEADQNGIITSYLVNITHVVTHQSVTRTSKNTSLFLEDLRPFTSYICRVAASTHVGVGPFSIPVGFLTQEAGKA